MAIPVGTVTKSTVAGRRLVGVTCEKCGTEFFYELTRQAEGKGSAIFFLGRQAAYERSVDAAESNLTRRLEREVELVPCPKCHWVNENAIRLYRSQSYRGATKLILLVVLGGFVGGILLMGALLEILGYNSRVLVAWIVLVWNLIIFTSPIWILIGRSRLRARIDPNIYYPQRAVIPAGTPPALLKVLDRQTGKQQYVSAAKPV